MSLPNFFQAQAGPVHLPCERCDFTIVAHVNFPGTSLTAFLCPRCVREYQREFLHFPEFLEFDRALLERQFHQQHNQKEQMLAAYDREMAAEQKFQAKILEWLKPKRSWMSALDAWEKASADADGEVKG